MSVEVCVCVLIYVFFLYGRVEQIIGHSKFVNDISPWPPILKGTCVCICI